MVTFLFVGLQLASAANKSTDENGKNIGIQLLKNAHVDFEVNKTNDYRWRNFAIGTGYGEAFQSNQDLSWQVDLNYNWGKYTFYDTGRYDLINRKTIVKTGSLTVPAIFEYKVYKSFYTGVNVFTGPVYEVILSAKADNDGVSFNDIAHSNFAWTFGGRVRFLAVFSLRVSYNYYPTGFFMNGDMNRSAVKVSLGF